jgi:heme exporter protein D
VLGMRLNFWIALLLTLAGLAVFVLIQRGVLFKDVSDRKDRSARRAQSRAKATGRRSKTPA